MHGGESENEVNVYLPFHAAFLTKPGSGMVGKGSVDRCIRRNGLSKRKSDPTCI